mmetsp:Transcript_1740/g.3856  ORF Transcript_1740/g.3856 Transcript_1740/m.3856 type:complete len:265 (-) Transcript_1740:70-864(-)|eukprot:CAMPEP_0204394782 /NCGR_PEP_ID=MMETSP0469-20131031/63009_1 /ASSEMBLY_ACC=CAM_ASM_000384 /TAXON_ID=2969 /ORGANISM="Oxyrrhis marina" /LENGTH=264 /DNA_ID=CAMNT_0051388893 /DNA_START=16 /DNA_END=810 /DNA_ORIENTATION=-
MAPKKAGSSSKPASARAAGGHKRLTAVKPTPNRAMTSPKSGDTGSFNPKAGGKAARSAQRGASKNPKSGTTGFSSKTQPVKKLSSKERAVTRVAINRAPVLTLWAAVVAQGLGHDEASALTFGKAVAGLAAIGKGRGLGLMRPAKSGKKGDSQVASSGKQSVVPLCGMGVAVVKTPEGLRAQVQGAPLDPYKVSLYLTKAFGDSLPAVHDAFSKLVSSFSISELHNSAFSVYEKIRPSVDKGVAGWGQKGTLDLKKVLDLARGK